MEYTTCIYVPSKREKGLSGSFPASFSVIHHSQNYIIKVYQLQKFNKNNILQTRLFVHKKQVIYYT